MKKGSKPNDERAQRRNFPHHTLQEAIAVPQRITDEMGGKPFKRLLLADALGIKPSSTNFRDILSSSYKYGLTEGTEKASEISLTELGTATSQTRDATKRHDALRQAALKPEVFGRFYRDYGDRKLPSPEMMDKILVSEYGVAKEHASECARLLIENGKFVGIVRDIGGSPHVLLDGAEAGTTPDEKENEVDEPLPDAKQTAASTAAPAAHEPKAPEPQKTEAAKPIFLATGRTANHCRSSKRFSPRSRFRIKSRSMRRILDARFRRR